jgi:hypothetical protein
VLRYDSRSGKIIVEEKGEMIGHPACPAGIEVGSGGRTFVEIKEWGFAARLAALIVQLGVGQRRLECRWFSPSRNNYQIYLIKYNAFTYHHELRSRAEDIKSYLDALFLLAQRTPALLYLIYRRPASAASELSP